jgi:hypothetical protein
VLVLGPAHRVLEHLQELRRCGVAAVALADAILDEHRPELDQRERPSALADATVAVEDRPGGVELDTHRGPREHGCEQQQAGGGGDDVDGALHRPRRRLGTNRRKPDHRQPFHRVDVRFGSNELVEPRHDVNLHVVPAEFPDDRCELLARQLRELDDHPLDVVAGDELRQLLHAANAPDHPAACLRGALVDEADEVHAVVRTAAELPRQQPRRVAAPEQDRILGERRAAAAVGTGPEPGEHDENDREAPEHDQLGRVRARDPTQTADDEEEPGPDRHDLEDADQVVDGRVPGVLFVSIVEAVQLREQEPARQRGEEEEKLRVAAERVRRRVPAAVDDRGEQERRAQPADVGHRERAANQSATPTLPRAGHGAVRRRRLDRDQLRLRGVRRARIVQHVASPDDARTPTSAAGSPLGLRTATRRPGETRERLRSRSRSTKPSTRA